MLNVAVVELGVDAIKVIFSMSNNLEKIALIESNGWSRTITRSTVQTPDVRQKAEDMSKVNEYETYCRVNNGGTWKDRTAGENIWGMKVAKSTMSKSGRAFKDQNRPKVGTAILYGGAGIVIGTVGGAAWALSKGVKGIASLAGMFGARAQRKK